MTMSKLTLEQRLDHIRSGCLLGPEHHDHGLADLVRRGLAGYHPHGGLPGITQAGRDLHRQLIAERLAGRP
jgi:hypothetical protein